MSMDRQSDGKGKQSQDSSVGNQGSTSMGGSLANIFNTDRVKNSMDGRHSPGSSVGSGSVVALAANGKLDRTGLVESVWWAPLELRAMKLVNIVEWRYELARGGWANAPEEVRINERGNSIKLSRGFPRRLRTEVLHSALQSYVVSKLYYTVLLSNLQDEMTPCWRCTTSIHPVHGFDDHECQACFRDRERRALPVLKKRNLKRMLEKKLEVREREHAKLMIFFFKLSVVVLCCIIQDAVVTPLVCPLSGRSCSQTRSRRTRPPSQVSAPAGALAALAGAVGNWRSALVSLGAHFVRGPRGQA
jgi:hypothetical protein